MKASSPLIAWAAALALPAAARASDVLPAASGSKPNIIFILADDAGIGDFSCYGCKYGTTPNIDRLAKEGMQFTRAYSGNAVCAPSRCSLMTGLHPGHALYRSNMDQLFLPSGQMTVARVLHDGGYATGGFGKWGLGHPGTVGAAEKEGFDVFFGYYDQVHAHDYYTNHLVRNGTDVPIPENAGGQKRVYSHNLIANETLKFIEQNKDHPFFCYAAWTPPHANYVIPSDAPYTDRPWSQVVKNYAAMVGLVDKDVGRVLQKLKDLGLDDKTLVIFASDNGANQEFIKPLGSTGGLRGYKRLLYEGGTRAPFLARWPGHIPPGSTSPILTTFIDMLPTVADLAGAPAPQGVDGISILPTLLGQEQKSAHEYVYFEIYEPFFQQSVRWGDWKGYRLGTKAPLELYDLKNDPKEETNLAAANPEVVKKLATILVAEHGASPHYNPPEFPGAKAKKKKATVAAGPTLQDLLDDNE